VIRQNALERHDPARMPLPRAINYAHPTASDFFENLIIPEEPIRIMTLDGAEQVVQRRLARRMPAVAINPRGKKTLQTKTATHPQCGPTFCANARLILETQRNGTAGQAHEGLKE
jgi:hypothetical protein